MMHNEKAVLTHCWKTLAPHGLSLCSLCSFLYFEVSPLQQAHQPFVPDLILSHSRAPKQANGTEAPTNVWLKQKTYTAPAISCFQQVFRGFFPETRHTVCYTQFMYVGMTKIPRWSKYNKNVVLKFSVEVWKTTAANVSLSDRPSCNNAIRKSKYLIVTTAYFIKSCLFFELMCPTISSWKKLPQSMCRSYFPLYFILFTKREKSCTESSWPHVTFSCEYHHFPRMQPFYLLLILLNWAAVTSWWNSAALRCSIFTNRSDLIKKILNCSF